MPQRRQNSMVRMPTRSIFGCSMVPSVISMRVQAMPRQPSSPARARPTGPPPTISTGARVVIQFFRSFVFSLHGLERRDIDESLPFRERCQQVYGFADHAVLLEMAERAL